MSSMNDYNSMNNYGLKAWEQPQQAPMFSQGLGYSPYTPVPAPVQGMDWGGGMPTGDVNNAMIASLTKAGNGTPGMFGGMFDGIKDYIPSGFFGSVDTKTGLKTDSWGGTALGVANGLFNGYMGMKQYGLQKDMFNTSKQQFERNFAAQKNVTNSQLADRQDRRNADAAFNGRSTTSTADYMKKYGVA